MTLKGHKRLIRSISYLPDGQRMISGSSDKTTRQWDLKEGKEIEEVRDVCKEEVWGVAVSRDSRWVVTGGKNADLKVFEVKTGVVKKLQGHSKMITCIDISADNTLLASGSDDKTSRIWNLETGKLVAGPFKSIDWVGAVRFSTDSKKLAVKSPTGKCLEVWDVQTQKLDKRIGNRSLPRFLLFPPIYWTNKNKNILASFSFTKDDSNKTIYEFDAATLETVGTPFEGHTNVVLGLALSFDGALLASSSLDETIKLWAFESRQLLASFDVQNLGTLILSPDSRKLAYTTYTKVLSNARVTGTTRYEDHRICICDIPPDILALAQARTIVRKKPALALSDPLNPDGTRRLVAGCRKRPIYIPPAVHHPPTTTPQQPSFRLTKLLRFSPRTNTLWPSRNNQPSGPLDSHTTLPLPPNRSPSPPLPSGRSLFNHVRSSVKGKQRAHVLPQTRSQTVDVPLGQATYADVVGVDDGERPYVLFFCLSWFQKKKKKEVPEPPVYDDELQGDEEEDVPDPVTVPPPRVQHEDIEMKTLASQSQPVAGPSRLTTTNHLEASSLILCHFAPTPSSLGAHLNSRTFASNFLCGPSRPSKTIPRESSVNFTKIMTCLQAQQTTLSPSHPNTSSPNSPPQAKVTPSPSP
ncbi:WD40-repeat-containing domain protein [Suillus occidentalis]|nr:WD40-repeat-containing domain protein [Suillus occidentalis]